MKLIELAQLKTASLLALLSVIGNLSFFSRRSESR